MRSIASRTEGALIVPQGTLSCKKSLVFRQGSFCWWEMIFSFLSLSSLTRFMISTAKSNDISRSLLSDIYITPFNLHYTIIISEAQGFALREVVACATVKYCASHKVKLSVPPTPAGASRCEASLHARSALHVPQGTLSSKKRVICLIDKWLFFRGAGSRGRTGTSHLDRF